MVLRGGQGDMSINWREMQAIVFSASNCTPMVVKMCHPTLWVIEIAYGSWQQERELTLH